MSKRAKASRIGTRSYQIRSAVRAAGAGQNLFRNTVKIGLKAAIFLDLRIRTARCFYTPD
jgi:hypothetical protein